MAYKPQRRQGIMLAYPFEEKRLSKWQSPWYAQPKLDGERCRCLIGEAGGVTLLSSEANEITSMPHIVEELEWMRIKREIELDGELYCHGMPFEEIHSRVSRKKELHPDYKSIEYHVFDIVDSRPQTDRLFELSGLTLTKHVHPVLPTVVYSLIGLMILYEIYVKDGYEGFIIRNKFAPYLRRRSIWMMKFKPKKEDMYLIAGTEEEVSIHGEKKDRLGALILHNPDIYMPGMFKVGTGFTAGQREDLWQRREELIGKVAVVKYQHLSEKRVPRFPVFVDIIDPKGLSATSAGGLLQDA
jgi:ATP-dependent DNA ligase